MALFTDNRLLDEQFFRDVSGVGLTDDITPYLQPMYIAEEVAFQQILGNDQFDELVRWNNLNSEDKAADSNNTLNTALLERFKHYLTFQTLYVHRTNDTVDYSDSGSSVWNGGDNNQVPTDEQLTDSALIAFQNAQVFKLRGIKWLNYNIEDYPLVGDSDSSEVRSDRNTEDTFPFTNI